jgi:prefoldin subunit 5
MMIQNDQKLQAMKERIAYFQQQVETLRRQCAELPGVSGRLSR